MRVDGEQAVVVGQPDGTLCHFLPEYKQPLACVRM